MRSFGLFALIAILSGCAQIFESNLFHGVDAPPPLTASAMSDASLDDIKSQLADPNTASSFYTQLQDNPDALAALQTNLTDQMNNATTPAATVDAAQTLVLVSAYGSGAGSTVNAAIQQASNLSSGGTPADAVKLLMAGKSEAEILAELTQFQNMQVAFVAMQTAATIAVPPSSHAVDANLFYGAASAATQGDLSQIALVTAAADALIRDNPPSIAALAHLMFIDAPLSATTTNIDKVSAGLDGTAVDPVADNPLYAYLSAVTDKVPF